MHVDNIVPESEGGGDEEGNIQALCHTCNTRAGTRTIDKDEKKPQQLGSLKHPLLYR